MRSPCIRQKTRTFRPAPLYQGNERNIQTRVLPTAGASLASKRNLAPCVYHCNTRGQVYKALNQSFLFLRNFLSSWGETLPISPIDRATECLIGFHSMLPNTATSMAMPKLNTKKGNVKE